MSYTIGKISAELSQTGEVTLNQLLEIAEQGLKLAKTEDEKEGMSTLVDQLLNADQDGNILDEMIVPDGMSKMLLGDKFKKSEPPKQPSAGGMGGDIALPEASAKAYLASVPKTVMLQLQLKRRRELARVTAEGKAIGIESFLEGQRVQNETLSTLEDVAFSMKMAQVDGMVSEIARSAAALHSSLYYQAQQAESDVNRAGAVSNGLDSDISDMKFAMAELLKEHAPKATNLIDILSKKKAA